MKSTGESQTNGACSILPAGAAMSMAEVDPGVETELARYLPHFSRMSEQLKQTSSQIESSVVEVCKSFQGIAEHAKETVARTTGFLSQESERGSNTQSFENLIENCSETLVTILNVTEEAGEISRRAIERIKHMDQASQDINAALGKLEQIARWNKTIALNARIEASRAGSQGAGFAVVAMEVLSQAEQSQTVNAQVSELILRLSGKTRLFLANSNGTSLSSP